MYIFIYIHICKNVKVLKVSKKPKYTPVILSFYWEYIYIYIFQHFGLYRKTIE